ncbi:MAG: glutathione S-transferase family protein [Rhizorhabdus sp.]
MKLYTCAGSRGLRVTWTLEELGIDYDLEALAWPPRQQPHVRSLNPLGTVPILVDQDVVLTESVAITHYLATRYGVNDLVIAVDEPDYAHFLDFLYHSDATLTFPQTVYLRFSLAERERGLEQAGQLYAEWFSARLAKISNRLATRTYLCADRFTIADIAIGYAIYLSRRIGLSDKVPSHLQNWFDHLADRDGFRRAMAREEEAAAALGSAAA